MLLNFATLMQTLSEGQQSVSPNLVLLVLIQLFYVLDYFWFEEGILVSRDIVHEGLGFNISMQFLMIPFTFCTQTRYVATTGYTSSSITLLAVFTIYGMNDPQILKKYFLLISPSNRLHLYSLICYFHIYSNRILDLSSQ